MQEAVRDDLQRRVEHARTMRRDLLDEVAGLHRSHPDRAAKRGAVIEMERELIRLESTLEAAPITLGSEGQM